MRDFRGLTPRFTGGAQRRPLYAVVGRQASDATLTHFCVLEYAIARATRLSAKLANVNSEHGSENAPFRPASLGERMRLAASYSRSRTIFVRRIS